MLPHLEHEVSMHSNLADHNVFGYQPTGRLAQVQLNETTHFVYIMSQFSLQVCTVRDKPITLIQMNPENSFSFSQDSNH